MSQRAKDLSRRIEAFKDDVIAFVDQLSGDDWNAMCDWEEWTVGVTARHLGAGHFGMFDLLEMIVQGQKLPQFTMDQINTMSDKDSQAHADCTKAEALAHLRKNGAQLAAYVGGLSNAELDRKGSMPALGGEASVVQAVDIVIFQSAQHHFDNMKKALGR